MAKQTIQAESGREDPHSEWLQACQALTMARVDALVEVESDEESIQPAFLCEWLS